MRQKTLETEKPEATDKELWAMEVSMTYCEAMFNILKPLDSDEYDRIRSYIDSRYNINLPRTLTDFEI